MKNLIWLLTLTLFSCAEAPKPQTSTKISIGHAALATTFPGGLFLIAHQPAINATLYKRLNDSEIELQLDNGKWIFSAVGYDGADLLTGNTYCSSRVAELDGQDIALKMDATQTKCANSDAYGTAHRKLPSGQTKPVELVACSGLRKLGLNKDKLYDHDNCLTNPGRHRSFRVRLYEFNLSPDGQLFSNQIGFTKSKCIQTVGNANFTNTSTLKLQIPEGFPFSVEMFEDTACTSPNTQIVNFHNGKDGGQNTQDQRGFVVSDDNKTKIYLNSEICADGYESHVDFTAQNSNFGADGSDAKPYFICNETQFGLMGTHSSSTAHIADDIDFGGDGDNAIVTSAFIGKLIGNNYTLHNYNFTGTKGGVPWGLIDDVGGGAEIRDIKLDNINMDISTVNNDGTEVYGLLIGHLYVSSSQEAKVENITITNSSIINASGAGNNTSVGGVIGKVNRSNGNITLRNIHSSANVTASGAIHVGVGGIIGLATSNDNTNTKVLFDNVNVIDAHIQATNVSSHTVGGVIGKAKGITLYNSSFKYNQSESKLTGKGSLGGLIGKSQGNTLIENYTDFRLDPQSGTVIDVGGAIGKVAKSPGFNDIILRNQINFENANSNPINYLGGIIGKDDSTSSGVVEIKNNKISFEMQNDGNNWGGIVGKFAGNNNTNNIVIQNNLAYSSMKEIGPASSNWGRGGVMGVAYSDKTNDFFIERNSIFTYIEGSKKLGGIVGEANFDLAGTSNKFFNENFIHTKINQTQTDNEIYSAGAFGKIDSPAAGVTIQINDNHLSGEILANDSGIDCNATNNEARAVPDYCGNMVGFNDQSGTTTVTRNIIETITKDGGATTVPGDAPPGISSASFSANQADRSTDPGGGKFVDFGASNWGLFFYKKLTDFGYKQNIDLNGNGLIVPDYKSGTNADPYEIHTAADWNKVKNDIFLLTKTFKLMDHLDFSIGFIPFGGDSGAPKEFTGNIIPNKKTISNLHSTEANIPASHPWGLIRVVGKAGGMPARIGKVGDPLIINGASTILNSKTVNDLGIVAGVVNAGEIVTRVTDAHIHINGGAVANGAGGLIGSLGPTNAELRLFNSLYSGKVEYTTGGTFNYVGGILGRATGTSGRLTILNTKAELEKLTLPSVQNGGGLIGENDLSSGGSSSVIKSNYVKFLPTSTLTNGPAVGGFFGSYSTATLGTEENHNNLVDISGLLTSPPANRVFSPTGSSTGGALKNYVVFGSHSASTNTGMVNSGANYTNHVLLGSDMTASGLLGSNKDNAFFFHPIENEVKLYWEIQPK